MDEDILLPSGKVIKAASGIIGLSPDLFGIFVGYDGSLEEGNTITKADEIELAEYMAALWLKYKEKIQKEMKAEIL